MKTTESRNWKLAVVLVALPLLAAVLPGPSNLPAADLPGSATVADESTSPLSVITITNFDALTNSVVATNSKPAVPADIKVYGGTAEIVKLAQGGVGEEVMMSYITNTKARFALTSDQIIYLNDLGVSGTVVTAMLQHDASMNGEQTPATNPAQQSDLAAAPAPAPGYDYLPPGEMSVPEIPPMDYAPTGNVLPPTYSEPYPSASDAGYFYDSLVPFGSWITIAGLGMCWQPTVYVRDHSWRPYGDRGRWMYTDAGWYWQSDYSWGWAAFHYGRWAHHHDAGWVWMPDRVWGPAWVSWRNAGAYAGWAPLPPGAVFVWGKGFEYNHKPVPANFDFGLQAKSFTFVPVAQLSDYNPIRYGVTRTYGSSLFGHSVVVNNRAGAGHGVTSPGVDPGAVETFGGSPIRRAVIHDAPADLHDRRPRMERVEKEGSTLVVTRPQLPPVGPKHIDGDAKSSTRPTGTILVPRQTSITSTLAPSASSGVALPRNRGTVNAPAGQPVSANPSPSRVHVNVVQHDDLRGAVTTTTSPAKNNDNNSRVHVYSGHHDQSVTTVLPTVTDTVLVPRRADASGNPAGSLVLRGRQDLQDNRGTDNSAGANRGGGRDLTSRRDGGANGGSGGVTTSGGGFRSAGDIQPSGRTLGGGAAKASSGSAGSAGSYLVPSRSISGNAGSSSSSSYSAPATYTAPVSRSAPASFSAPSSGQQGGYLVPASRSTSTYSAPQSSPAPAQSQGSSGGGNQSRGNQGGGNQGGGRGR